MMFLLFHEMFLNFLPSKLTGFSCVCAKTCLIIISVMISLVMNEDAHDKGEVVRSVNIVLITSYDGSFSILLIRIWHK